MLTQQQTNSLSLLEIVKALEFLDWKKCPFGHRLILGVVVHRLKELGKTEEKVSSKTNQVLGYLLSGRSLSSEEAVFQGLGTRLPAIIHRLKERGHDIETHMRKSSEGYSFAEYSLVTRNSFTGKKSKRKH